MPHNQNTGFDSQFGGKLVLASNRTVARDVMKSSEWAQILITGQTIDYSQERGVFMATTHTNPHFWADVPSQLTLINGTTTRKGLTDILATNLLEFEHVDLGRNQVQIMESKLKTGKHARQIGIDIRRIV
jgi:hypothetical protein